MPSLTLKPKDKVVALLIDAKGSNFKRPASMSSALIDWLSVTFCHTPSSSLYCKVPLDDVGKVVMTTA